MRINNIDKFKKEELFFCYSKPVWDFLIDNNIHAISYGFNTKTEKFYRVFVKTNELKEFLNIWRERRKNIIE